jgi:hypothetical protein
MHHSLQALMGHCGLLSRVWVLHVVARHDVLRAMQYRPGLEDAEGATVCDALYRVQGAATSIICNLH